MTAPTSEAREFTEWHESAPVEVIRATNPPDLNAALEIRRRVFAEEQGVADLRVSDADDARSVIALAFLPWHGDRGAVRHAVATGRLTPPVASGGQALIAWVATLPEARGRGAGSDLMRFLLDFADAAGTREVALAAQAPAEVFYRRLGFISAGPRYDVRGIPHLRMIRRLPR